MCAARVHFYSQYADAVLLWLFINSTGRSRCLLLLAWCSSKNAQIDSVEQCANDFYIIYTVYGRAHLPDKSSRCMRGAGAGARTDPPLHLTQ